MPSDRMVPSGSEAEILTRIHDTTMQLVTLNRRLNFHRPIFRLPPELLLKIFSLIVAEWKKRLVSQNTWHQRNKDVKPMLSYKWIPMICGVCHHWRTLALKSPRLWNTIIVCDGDSFPAMLKRSRDVSLSLFYLVGPIPADLSRQIHLCGAIQPHFHRIKSLAIASASPSDGIRDALPRGRPPLLQEITIGLAPEVVSANVVSDPLDALIGSWIGNDHDKHVTSSLFCVGFNTLQSAVHGNLRRLSLVALPPSITMPMLLSVLKRVSRLESLSLDKATPPTPQEIHELPQPSEVVVLRRLRHLSLISPGQSLTNFMRHISYPALTSMNIEVEGFENRDRNNTLYGRELGIKLLPRLRHILVGLAPAFYMYGWHTHEPRIPMTVHAVLPDSPCTVGIFTESCNNLEQSLKAFVCMLTSVITEDLQTLYLAFDFPSYMQSLWDGAELYHALATKAINMVSLSVTSTFYLQEILTPKGRTLRGIQCPALRNVWIDKLPRQDVTQLCSILEEWKRSSNVVLRVLSIPQGGGGMPETRSACEQIRVPGE